MEGLENPSPSSTEWFLVLQNTCAYMSTYDLMITQWSTNTSSHCSDSETLSGMLEVLQLLLEPWSESPRCPSHGRICSDSLETLGQCRCSSCSPPAAAQTLAGLFLLVSWLTRVPLSEAQVPGHFLLPAALMELRVRSPWEVRHSSEERKLFWFWLTYLGKKNKT